MKRTSHDCIRDAIARNGLTDAEMVAELTRQGALAPERHINQLKNGGPCTLMLSLAIFSLIATQDAARAQPLQ